MFRRSTCGLLDCWNPTIATVDRNQEQANNNSRHNDGSAKGPANNRSSAFKKVQDLYDKNS